LKLDEARRVPRGVWLLGFVSLLMDVSSEMIHCLLPVFMVSVLGASALAVGLVEGVAEATALIVKVFSGALSDFIGRRKELAVFGYGLGAVSKPLFALGGSVDAVLGARFIDRVGKGMRGAPRDALIADMTPRALRGEAYGLRQSLDTVGAFLGPLAALGLMAAWSGDFRRVFWVAAFPAALAVALLAFGVREPQPADAGRPRTPVSWRSLERLDAAYWRLTALGAVFTLARFSEAFLILRAKDRGLSDRSSPLVFIAMNVVYALSVYPVGLLADRMDRRRLMAGGLAVLAAADVVLARAAGLPAVAAGVALWGLHMGLTQGVLSAMVADAAPPELRGSAFGFFNLASGVAMLAASVLAGFLWQTAGPAATFEAGAGFALAALVLLGADAAAA